MIIIIIIIIIIIYNFWKTKLKYNLIRELVKSLFTKMRL